MHVYLLTVRMYIVYLLTVSIDTKSYKTINKYREIVVNTKLNNINYKVTQTGNWPYALNRYAHLCFKRWAGREILLSVHLGIRIVRPSYFYKNYPNPALSPITLRYILYMGGHNSLKYMYNQICPSYIFYRSF